MKSWICLVLLFCLNAISVNAQYSRLFTIENGLSSSMINNIYQDSRGYIWISTGDGLNRYDGVKFVKYRAVKNDSTSLSSNNVYSVYENVDGKVFVLSSKGLQYYDYATDSFRALVRSSGAYNNKCILRCKDGTILVGTSGFGIKKYLSALIVLLLKL